MQRHFTQMLHDQVILPGVKVPHHTPVYPGILAEDQNRLAFDEVTLPQ